MHRQLLSLFFILCTINSLAQWSTVGNHIYNANSGNVGIGVSAPAYALDIIGTQNYQTLRLSGGVPLLKFANASYNNGNGGELYQDNGGVFRFNVNSFTSGFLIHPDGRLDVPNTMSVNGYTGFGTLTLESRLHVVGEGRFSGFGWFGRNNGGGAQKLTFRLGQVDGWDSPVAELLTGDAGGYSRLDWRGLHWGYKVRHQRFGPSGYGNILEFGGNEGGDTYLTLFSKDGVNEKIKFVADGSSFMVGNLGIGTTHTNDPAYQLFVEKGIRTRKVRVDQSSWPDYVFHSTYQLPTLQQVEQYIKTHQHLPDVPSAKEVEKEGLDVGDNQAVLLKKIEELTLYVIEQNKKIEELQKQNRRIDQMDMQLKQLSAQSRK